MLMHLDAEPYAAVLAGTKRVEIRLNDAKRQTLVVGMEVTFNSRNNSDETISCIVKDLQYFGDFEAAYQVFPKERKYHAAQYYQANEIAETGLVAIVLS